MPQPKGDLRCDLALKDLEGKDTQSRCRNPGLVLWTVKGRLSNEDQYVHLCSAHFEHLKLQGKHKEPYQFLRLGPNRKAMYERMKDDPEYERGTL